jgi:hypothetical protein
LLALADGFWTTSVRHFHYSFPYLIIGGAAPATSFLTWKMLENGLGLDPVAVPMLFLVLVSLALCIATGRLRFLPIVFVWNAIFGAAAFGMIYAVIRLLAAANDWYEFVQWPIFSSMFALSFGSWIIWCERFAHPRTAEIVGPERRERVSHQA